MMVLLFVAMIAEAILYLVGIGTAQNKVWAMIGFGTFGAIYSIAHRHHLRRQLYLQQVVK